MKRVGLLTTISLMLLSHSFAQSVDSVKVRLRTSAGAEIGIDGDQSSTNLLTKKVSVGSHTVTVTYGTRYTKDYPINVTQSDTEFDFLIDGQLTVKSIPASKSVYIDGIQQGRTPITLNILGEHNLRIEGDNLSYFDFNERITVSPFDNVEREITLTKRPPRTYGMVLANYMPVSGSPGVGLTLAFVKRWGLCARLTLAGDGNDSHHEEDYGLRGSSGPGFYEKDKDNYGAINGGLIFRLSNNIFVYGGSGYGEYTRSMTNGNHKITPYNSKGVMADAGVILKWRALLAQVGYNRILGEGNPDPFGSIYLGVGFTIHKQKRDKQ